MIDDNAPRFSDIEPYVPSGSYRVNVGLKYLASTVFTYIQKYGLDMNPDFQRGPVWTEEQKERYVEHLLRGGKSGREIWINCPTWDRGDPGISNPNTWMVLVDGRQRLTALLEFLSGEVRAFGHFFPEYKDTIRHVTTDLVFNVNSLATRRECLLWYLQLNDGGVAHTQQDLDKVRKLLEDDVPYQRETPAARFRSGLHHLKAMQEAQERYLAEERRRAAACLQEEAPLRTRKRGK